MAEIEEGIKSNKDVRNVGDCSYELSIYFVIVILIVAVIVSVVR